MYLKFCLVNRTLFKRNVRITRKNYKHFFSKTETNFWCVHKYPFIEFNIYVATFTYVIIFVKENWELYNTN